MTVNEFIHNNIDYIDNNNWSEVYNNLAHIFEGKRKIGEFTQIIMNADMHPELYLDKIPDHFLVKSTISDFVIPSTITEIGVESFEACSELSSIIIPGSVTTVGFGAFVRCFNLKRVLIEDGVKNLNQSAFWKCINLEEVTLPKSLEVIQPLCFGHCNNLTIKYLGTIKQFKRLLSRDVFYEANAQIICSNGTLEISNKSFY